MSGTDAAATLSLEISTGGAEAKLRELAAAYATLKTELSGNVSASGISSATNAELVAVRKELAATKASYVALNDTVEGFKKKMNTPIQGGGTGMFTGLNKDIERSSSNLRIMLTSAEMTGNAAIKAADSLRKMNDSGFDASKLAENLGIQKQVTEQMVAQAALRELNVSGTQAAERVKVALSEKQVTEQMVAQAALRELNVSGARAAELAKVVAEEKQVTAQNVAQVALRELNVSGVQAAERTKALGMERQITEQNVAQAALRELNVSGTQAAERAKVLLEEKQVTEQMVAQAALRELNVSGTRSAELAKILVAERQVTKELEAQARWVALTEKQRAQATVQASKALYSGAQQNLLPGVAGSSQALAAAQSAGSTAAAQAALDALTVSHTKAVPAVQAHTKATHDFSKAADEAHAFARGLSGSLGTLWMTYGSMVPLLAGAALAGGFMQAAKAGSEFAYQLTFVKALGGESAESVAQIGTAALNLSKTSMYGPVELANGLRILSQAGLDAKSSMQALPSAMQLATVGEMSMEQASITLVGVMNAFGESLSALPHIGDMFAKAAAMSQTSVSGMADAMKTASVVHDQYGASIEDTATAITLLAKVNITGTAAGTSYRNMLKDLYTPSKQAAAVIKQLGLETKDSMGNLREAPEIMFDLQKILKGYTQGSQTDILGKIFSERGGKEAIQILNQTRESWEKTKASISNSDGFMSNVTSELEMTTAGRFKQALNTMQSNLIGAFDTSEGSVRGLADSLRNLADSPEFIAGINLIVNGMTTLAKVVVDLLPALEALGIAWAVFKGLGTAVAGLEALGAALSAVAGGAGVVAGTAGLGGVGAALALMSNPLTWAVAGLGALAVAAYNLKEETPKGISALQDFNSVLDRQILKLREANAEMERKNRLQNTGSEVDMDEAQRRITAANAVKSAAQARIASRTSTAAASDNGQDRDRAENANQKDYQTIATSDAEIAKTGQKLMEARNQQDSLNRSTLAGIIKQAKDGLSDLEDEAERGGKKIKTSAVEGVIKALQSATGSPEQRRKLEKELAFQMGEARKGLLGEGPKTFVPEVKPKAGAALKTQALDARANKSYLDYYVSEYKAEEALNKSNVQSKLESEEAYRENLLSIADKYNDKIATRYTVEVEKLQALRGKGSADEQALAEINYWKLLKDQDTFLNSKDLALKESYNRESKTHNEGIANVAKQIAEQEAVTRQAIEGFAKERLKLSMTPADAAYYDASQSSLNKSDKGIADLTSKKDSMLSSTNADGVSIYSEQSREIKDLIEQINMLKDARERLADASGAAAKAENEYKQSFSYGWADAFKSYADNAENYATKARDVFSASTTFMENALTQFITTGKVGWRDIAASALASVAKTMSSEAMASFMGVAVNFVSSMFSSPASGTGGAFAKGGVFTELGSLHQYVNTVQTSPKYFTANANGNVFAEAGPEAVMPLSRDSTGRLGVKSQGGSAGTNVSIGITINEADGTTKTSTSGDSTGAWTQFSAKVKAMITEQMLIEKRPGGLLYA